MTIYRLMYLGRRKPGFTRTEFVAKWRNHFRLAASMEPWRTVQRYIQCEVLHDETDPPYDCFATVEYVSMEARNSNRGATEYHRILQEDELRTFDQLVNNFNCIATHELVWGEGRGPTKVVRLVTRAAGLSPAEFEAGWSGSYAAQLLATTAGFIGYARNVVIPTDRESGWGLNVAGAEELWFGTPEAAITYLKSDQAASLRACGRGLFEHTIELVTDEVVLYDVPRAPA